MEVTNEILLEKFYKRIHVVHHLPFFFIQKTCVTIDLEIRIVSRSYFAGLSAFFLVLLRSKMVIQKVEDEFRHRP